MTSKILAFAFLSFAMFISSYTAATDIVVNGNCTITVTSANGVTIDPSTGNLIADGTYGSSCPGGSGTVSPIFTTALHSDQNPATAGTGFNLSWATSNVNSNCTTDGSSFPAGASFGSQWPTSGAICSGSACAAGSVLLNTSITGTYNFQLHCYRTGNPTPVDSSLSLSVTSGSSGACTGVTPAGLTRQASASVLYPPGATHAASVTAYENVFGYDPNDVSTQTLQAWPSWPETASIPINRNQFVALQFTVPSSVSPGLTGDYYRQASFTQAAFSITVSTCPGDFRISGAGALPTGCYANATTSKGGLYWQAVSTGAGLCSLQAGQTYYLNILSANLETPTTTTCLPTIGTACRATVTTHWH